MGIVNFCVVGLLVLQISQECTVGTNRRLSYLVLVLLLLLDASVDNENVCTRIRIGASTNRILNKALCPISLTNPNDAEVVHMTLAILDNKLQQVLIRVDTIRRSALSSLRTAPSA